MGSGSAAPKLSQHSAASATERSADGEPRSPRRRISDFLQAHPDGLAITTVALAVLLRFLIDPWLGDQMPYITFVLAVAATGLYAGARSALLTSAVGAIIAYWCFVPPRYQWGFQGVSDAVGFASYLAVAMAIVLLTSARNSATKAAQRSLQEQIDTARELLDAEALFQAFMENVPGCAYLRDECGEHTYMNATARQFFGVPAGVAGASADWLPRDLAERFRGQDDAVLRSGQARQFVDTIMHPDGQHSWLTIKFPFVDQAGRRFVGGTSFDITDRLRAEDVLRQTEKLAGAAQMASLLAHEINNPLAAITNVVYLLQRELLPSTAGDYVSIASQQLQRLNHIAALTLGFYNSGEAPTTIDVCKLMDEVADGLLAMSTFQGIELTRQYEAGAEFIGSELKTRQLLTNLLVNAFESGTKTVRVRVRYATDWRTGARRGIRITIADAGPGISPPDLDHIFEPFFTTKSAKGMGLGLWASRMIVLRRDGSIRLRSTTAGRSGTSVSVFLPLPAASRSVQGTGGMLVA